MDMLGTPVIELNKEYDDEMARHVTMKYVSTKYTFTEENGYTWEDVDVPMEKCEESHFMNEEARIEFLYESAFGTNFYCPSNYKELKIESSFFNSVQ